MKVLSIRYLLFLIATFLFFTSATNSKTSTNLPEIGTQETVARIDDVDIEVKVQGPAAADTPLQIICLFEYVEGDIFKPPALPKELNGLVHVDEAFNGLITDLRRTNRFEGKLLETLLIEPAKNTIPAKKLLLIGLGNRNNFKPEMMQSVGVVGMREALRLGVASYSHASDLKDAGFDSPVADVAGYVVQGAIKAYRTQMYLFKKNASSTPMVNKLTLLAGPSFYEEAKTGIKKIASKHSK